MAGNDINHSKIMGGGGSLSDPKIYDPEAEGSNKPMIKASVAIANAAENVRWIETQKSSAQKSGEPTEKIDVNVREARQDLKALVEGYHDAAQIALRDAKREDIKLIIQETLETPKQKSAAPQVKSPAAPGHH